MGKTAAWFYEYYKAGEIAPLVPPETTVMNFLRKAVFNLSGFNQYGLYHDDLLYQYPDVMEAVRRLPQALQDERNYRLIRASQLDLNNQILPKEQWVTFEQDRQNRYLEPYLEEVRREIQEKDEYYASN